MKTAGTSFVAQIQQNFGIDHIYPSAHHVPEKGVAQPYVRVDALVNLSAAERAQTHVYAGHFPFVAYELLGVDAVTLTILREPVERTVSMLKHCKREIKAFSEMDLDEIYERGLVRAAFVDNFQTKQFAFTRADAPPSSLAALAIDDDRLRLAISNLDSVDVVGATERYDVFLARMRGRYGWTFTETPKRNVSKEPWDASPELRSRIAKDNRFDIAFYEHAKDRAGL
jgi:hypothetical protein